MARTVVPTEEERPIYRGFNMLTAKPTLYAANVLEDDLATRQRPTSSDCAPRSPRTASRPRS